MQIDGVGRSSSNKQMVCLVGDNKQKSRTSCSTQNFQHCIIFIRISYMLNSKMMTSMLFSSYCIPQQQQVMASRRPFWILRRIRLSTQIPNSVDCQSVDTSRTAWFRINSTPSTIICFRDILQSISTPTMIIRNMDGHTVSI